MQLCLPRPICAALSFEQLIQHMAWTYHPRNYYTDAQWYFMLAMDNNNKGNFVDYDDLYFTSAGGSFVVKGAEVKDYATMLA